MKKIILSCLSVLLAGSFCFADTAKGYEQINLNDKNQQKVFAELNNVLEQQKTESEAPYSAMQRIVENHYLGFTGRKTNFDSITKYKCDTVRMYYIEPPEHSYVKYVESRKIFTNSFTRIDNPIVYVKCFVKGTGKTFDVIPSPIFTSLSGKDLGVNGDSIYSPTIYELHTHVYQTDAAGNRIGKYYPKEIDLPEEEPSFFDRHIALVSEMKPIGEIDSLKKKEIKTFYIENYR